MVSPLVHGRHVWNEGRGRAFVGNVDGEQRRHLCRSHGIGRGVGRHDGDGQHGETGRVGHLLLGGQRQRARSGYARGSQSGAIPQGNGGFHSRIQPCAEQPGEETHHRPLAGGMDGAGGNGEEMTYSTCFPKLRLPM